MSKKSSPKKGTRSSSQKAHGKSKPSALSVVNPNAAGIDVGSTSHYVAVPPGSVAEGESAVRKFGGFTPDLDQMVEWLKACGVTTVAMESTGVDWIAPYEKLKAAGLEVLLVNAKAVKHVPGRKTDVQDCQWLQQLHSYGLLRGSFRPDPLVCELRTLVRHRGNIICQAASLVQQMQKALSQMNLHLHHAVSDVMGETGLRILKSILAGQHDPEQLVKLRDPQIKKSTEAEMKKALQGDYRAEHLFVLEQSLEAWEFCHRQIEQCDRKVEEVLKKFPTAAIPAEKPEVIPPLNGQTRKKKQPQSRRRNEPAMDLAPQLARICGIDLTQSAGLRILTVLSLISEIGLDMSRWPNEKAFSSWLGLCPHNKISGGRILSRRTRKVVNRAATALRLAAYGLARSDDWLGLFHRRMRSRLGPAAAITATAHKLARIIYHLLKNKEPYVALDSAQYLERIHRVRLGKLKKQAADLGFQLVEEKRLSE
jgi:transposase